MDCASVQYTVIDCFENRVYYFQEREREHIIPERWFKGQGYLLRYLDRIPVILHTPTKVIVDPKDDTVRIYYRKYRIAENPAINRLAVVVKEATVKFILTFYGHAGRRPKGETRYLRAFYLKR